MANHRSRFVFLAAALALATLAGAGNLPGQTISFIARRDFGVGAAPTSVAVGDFNGDGAQDLAVANFGSNDVSVLRGNGDGTFQAAVNFGVGERPFSVAVGDFNGDGPQDLAVANYFSARPPGRIRRSLATSGVAYPRPSAEKICWPSWPPIAARLSLRPGFPPARTRTTTYS